MASMQPKLCVFLQHDYRNILYSSSYLYQNCQGLTNLGGIIGVVLAMVIISPLSNWWIVWMSRRNRGVYEPEYRLVFMFGMLFGVFGFVGWAIGNEHHMPWVGAVACITYVPSFPAPSIHCVHNILACQSLSLLLITTTYPFYPDRVSNCACTASDLPLA